MKIRSITESKNQTKWYRGSNNPNPLEIRSGGNEDDQLGPGLYFTDNYEIATKYGKVKLYQINTTTGFYTKGQPIDINKIKELINYADQEHLTISLTNWDENSQTAIKLLLNSLKNNKDMPEAIQQTVTEVFRRDREDFLIACRASNINGIIIEDPYNSGRTDQFLVLYNPKLATIQDHDPTPYWEE